MNNQTIVMCVVALLLGMLLFHMLKGVCGCKVVEGQLADVGDSCTMMLRSGEEGGTWQDCPGNESDPCKWCRTPTTAYWPTGPGNIPGKKIGVGSGKEGCNCPRQ